MLGRLASVVFIGVALCFVVWFAWVGHLASDDGAYIAAAEAWRGDDPMIPGNHWAVRHPITIAIAASFAAFGQGEVQSILPSLIVGICVVLLVFLATAAVFDFDDAIFASLVLVATPLFAELLTAANIDIFEAFFALTSLGAFLIAAERRGSPSWLVLSGVLAGLAFESRDTAVALLVFYGLAFIARPTIDRWRYVIMAVGFWAVVGIEMLYYAVVAGNPLLRFEIALHAAGLPNAGPESVGSISINRWIDPVLAMLFNNEFGLLFWFAAPAAVWLLRPSSGLSPRQRRVVHAVLGLAVVWFLVGGYALDLRALPRYFIVTTIVAAALVGVSLSMLLKAGRRWVAFGSVALFLVSSLLLMDLSNQQLLLPERTAVQLAAENGPSPIHTDPRTAWRSEMLAEWQRLPPGRIVGAPPPPDVLYIYSARAVALENAGPNGRFDRKAFEPSPTWQVVETIRGEPTVVGRVADRLGLVPLLEKKGLGRLIWETAPVVIYRSTAPSSFR